LRNNHATEHLNVMPVKYFTSAWNVTVQCLKILNSYSEVPTVNLGPESLT